MSGLSFIFGFGRVSFQFQFQSRLERPTFGRPCGGYNVIVVVPVSSSLSAGIFNLNNWSPLKPRRCCSIIWDQATAPLSFMFCSANSFAASSAEARICNIKIRPPTLEAPAKQQAAPRKPCNYRSFPLAGKHLGHSSEMWGTKLPSLPARSRLRAHINKCPIETDFMRPTFARANLAKCRYRPGRAPPE